jgi:hypothetical protein
MNVSILPIWIISLFTKNNERTMHLNILLSTVIIFCTFSVLILLPHFCLFKFLFSIPCPGCGILTSVYAISKMEWKFSFISNPVGIPLVIFYILQLPLRSIALINPEKFGVKITKFFNVYSTGIITSLMLVWIINLFGGYYDSTILP